MIEVIPYLFYLFLLFGMFCVLTLCEGFRKTSLTCGVLGAITAFFFVTGIIHGHSIADSRVTYPAAVVQIEEFDNGMRLQYITDHLGKRHYLDPRYWRPETTYYKETYASGTLYWTIDHVDQDFEYFTIEEQQND